MTTRRLIGVGLLLLGAFLFWQGLQPVLMITARGSSLSAALFEPPSGILRLVGAGLALLGGLLAALNIRGGALLAALGTLIFGALTALIVMATPAWANSVDDMTSSALLLIGSAALLFMRRDGAASKVYE